MNKKIIAIAIMLLAVVVVFAACKKDDDYKVDHTVKLENGDIVEVYEDEDGEQFVTNVDGDKIPVTTDKDGFFDNIEDLITETTTKKSDKTTEADKSSTTTTEKPADDKDEEKDKPSTSNKNDEPSSTEKKEDPTSATSGIEIGDDANKGGSIDWDDIVAVP